MSYRCGICEKNVPPRSSQLRHIVYRKWVDHAGNGRLDVVSETPVCKDCHTELKRGRTLDQLRNGRLAPTLPPKFFTTNLPVESGRDIAWD